MSVLFDESDNYLGLASFPSLPDGDWTLDCWVKLADNTGSASQAIFGYKSLLANPSFNWYFREASNTNAGKLHLLVCDNDTTDINSMSSTTPGTSTVWQHCLIVRSGTTIKQFVGGSEVSSADATSLDATTVNAAAYLGSQDALNANYMLGGRLAEFAFWTRALSGDDITGRASGKSALWYLTDLGVYMPLKTSIADVQETVTITDHSSGIDADHPTISDPVTFSAAWARDVNQCLGV